MIALSVVVPVRDVERYVPDLLRSLVRNTRPDFEFIVVDDGSTDRTPDLVSASGLPGLTVLRHEQPRGPSSARNTGLAASSGRYITFLDGDDWIRPGYLYDLVAVIEDLGCDFVMSDHVQVRGQARTVRRTPQGRRGQVLQPRGSILPLGQPSMVDYPYTWAGIYSRSLADQGLLDFVPTLHTAEDRPWFWRLYREASSFATVSLQGVFYRRSVDGSLTTVGDERQLHFFDAFDLVLSDLAEDPEAHRFLPKAIRNYCAMIAFHLGRRDRLTPELQHRLMLRARATMKSLPAETRAEVLPGMGDYRQELFSELIGIRI
jgi:glycosyltransferase involved in cell wall biosynthesis